MKNKFIALFSKENCKFLFWVGITVLVILLISLLLAIPLVMAVPSVECFFMFLTGIQVKPELLNFMGWGIGGLVAILGVMGLFQRATALDKQNEVTGKGHIYERFKAAIEHLGDARVSIRISAFYEFYGLIEIEADLKEPIFNILCAHLRKSTNDKNYQIEIKNRDDADDYIGEHKKIEVQILLDILFKEHKDKLIFDGLVANLEGADLPGVNLQNAKLQNAKLQNAKLQNAKLQNANLCGAKIDTDTQMPNDWEGMVKRNDDGKTGVLLVDDKEKVIKQF